MPYWNIHTHYENIPQRQGPEIRRICSTFQLYHGHCRTRIENLLKEDIKTMPSYSKFRKLTKQIGQQKRNERQCIALSVTYSHELPNLNDTLAQSFSTLPIIAFIKNANLEQIIKTSAIHNNRKLIKIKNDHIGKRLHVIQPASYAVNNYFEQQHSKVIRSIKHSASIKYSTAKANLLSTYQNTMPAKFNTLFNQKHH